MCDIAKLQRELNPEEISFMPKNISKSARGDFYCLLIPYKTARVDMDILDDACGSDRWQNEYKRDSNGVLQCGIGIYFESLSDWVWKFSNGTPSFYEKEKGEYSDAFKRAGFMWGIGRELYSYPKMGVILNEEEFRISDSGKPELTYNFKPHEWEWKIKKTDSGKVWVIGSQWFGQTKKERVNTNPLKSKNPRS